MSQHSFDIMLAKNYDVETAIMINTIDFWLHKNLMDGGCIHRDTVWTTFKPADMVKYYCYWNERKIRSILVKMINEYDILEKENFHAWDRVNSYRFTDTFMETHGHKLKIKSFFALDDNSETNVEFLMKIKRITNYVEPRNTTPTEYPVEKPVQSISLNEVEYSMLDLLEYWNTKENLNSHRLPIEVGEGCTALVKNTTNYLTDIIDGNFFTSRYFENENIKTTKTYTKEEIKVAIDRLDKSFGENYLPKNKKSIPKDFKTFIYNPRTKTSKLRYFLENEVQPLNFEVSPTILNKYKTFFGGDITANQVITLKDKITKLAEAWRNFPKLQQIYPKFSSYYGTLSAFYETHYNYLKQFYTDGITTGHLNTYGKVWERFIAWSKDTHGVDLEISESKLRSLKIRRMDALIQSGKYKREDFDKDGNLKES